MTKPTITLSKRIELYNAMCSLLQRHSGLPLALPSAWLSEACLAVGKLIEECFDGVKPDSKAAKPEPPLVDLGALIEQLCIANIKLFKVCDQKETLSRAHPVDGDLLAINARQDIELCKLRGQLKNQINQLVSGVQDVKLYGGNP